MARRPGPSVSSRKEPRQARAHGLVAAVLDAAVQVLRAEGAARFTTARVAERAGVGVGSLYQYFPNKAAILFRLQSDEWRRTGDLLRGLLANADVPPPARLRALVHAFLRSECDEARAGGSDVIRAFMNEALPAADNGARRLAADLIEATLTQVGRSFSETERSEAEIATFAEAMADMFCTYLRSV